MTLEQRKALRRTLFGLGFRKTARSRDTGGGKYQERWTRTKQGRVTDTVLIDWDEVTK